MPRKFLDLGPTPSLDDLEGQSEAGRAHTILQKFDKLGAALIDHEERLADCEALPCKDWHEPLLKWLLGLVIAGGGGAVVYLLMLAAGKLFGG